MSAPTVSGPLATLVRRFLYATITVVLVAAAALFGTLAIVATPREENPRVTVPTAIVTTVAVGRSRDEVERLITIPLERVIGAIASVEHVYSTSQDGRSTITVRYRVGTDTSDAYVDLYTRLLGNRSAIPADAADPVVSRIDVDDVPVVVFTLSSATYDEGALRELGYRLSDVLAPLPGVGAVTLYGGRGRIVDVALDPSRMMGDRLGFAAIETALGAGAERSAGYAADGAKRVDLVAGTPFPSAGAVANVPVAVRDGVSIRLGDVATVRADLAPRESYTWTTQRDGALAANAVSVAVAKRGGSNVVVVADAAASAARRFSLPNGVRLDVTRDDGRKANAAVNELFQRLIEAIAIVTVLLVFTLGWREAVVVASAIPLTLFITLGIAMLAHQTINRITLFALILSLGLLVDDAIVVIENIHRHLRDEDANDRAGTIARAVAQVASPTILATLTVILAFLPMAFVTGLMGPYMRPIPLDVPVAMLASLGVAIVVTPWAALRLLRPKHRAEAAPGRWARTYRRIVETLHDDPRVRRTFLGVVALALGCALALPAVGLVKFRMLPAQNENTFSVAIDLPVGTDLERTRAAARAVETALLRDGNVRDVETSVGTHAVPDFNGVLRGSFLRDAAWNAELRVNLIDRARRRIDSEELVRELRPALQTAGAPFGASVRLVEEPPGPPVRATVHAIVLGPDGARRDAIARDLLARVRAEPGVVDTDTTVKAQPTRGRVTFDLRAAALSGIDPALAGREVAAAFGGISTAGVRLPDARDPVPIFLRFAANRRRDFAALSRMSIPNADGIAVPLRSVAHLTSETRPAVAYREDGASVAYVTGEMAGRSSTYAVLDLLLGLWREHRVPAGYRVRWDGEWQLTLDVFRDLGLAMAVAVALIYLVLVARFGSLRTPLVILSAVPLGLIGVLPGFAMLAPFGIYFSATAMIGVIALAGIVVRNSIVLVEFIEERIAHGVGLREALIDAGTVRARPIALTAAAGMMSAIVIAMDPVWSGLAWALVFGMAASATLSLVVVPVLYAIAVGQTVDASMKMGVAGRTGAMTYRHS